MQAPYDSHLPYHPALYGRTESVPSSRHVLVRLEMLNAKVNLIIAFCHSRFHEHSNRLSFSNSAGVAADLIVLAATVAGVYNGVRSHTEVLTLSVECGKQKLDGNMQGTGRQAAPRWPAYRRTHRSSLVLVSVAVWTGTDQ